jgi:hypothetical protein
MVRSKHGSKIGGSLGAPALCASELARRPLFPTYGEGTARLSNSYAFAAIFEDDQAR